MGALFEISVRSNLADLGRDIQLFAEDQLPYATSRALNRMGRFILDEERDLMSARFHVRSRWMLRAFRLIQTNKREWPNMEVIGGHPFWAMKLHELSGDKTGGTQTPGEVYIPTRVVAAMRSPLTGNLPTSLYPKALLESGQAYEAENRVFGKHLRAVTSFGVGKGRGARNKITGDVASIRGSGRLQVLYLIRPRAHILAKWGFGAEANELAARIYPDIFIQEMTNAVRTSKHHAATAARIMGPP